MSMTMSNTINGRVNIALFWLPIGCYIVSQLQLTLLDHYFKKKNNSVWGPHAWCVRPSCLVCEALMFGVWGPSCLVCEALMFGV